MTRYVILRHGSNAANQSMTLTAVLGTVEAPDRRSAVDAAAERWTCYNGQHFDPIPWSRASRRDRDDALENDEAER